MPSHFTFNQYAKLLDTFVEQGLVPFTVRDFLRAPPEEGGPFVIIRHDVEWGVKRALRMAELEAERGLCATYYFHGPHRKRVFDPEAMKRCESLGHEVGYHYETLDLTDGDFTRAEQVFAEQLKQFRDAGVTIDSVCMHGNPRKKKTTYQRNGDLFKGRIPEMCERYALCGEAYESIAFDELSYASDVGIRFRNWGDSCPEFARILTERNIRDLYVLTHPDYWSGGACRAFLLWSAGCLMRSIRINRIVAEAKARLFRTAE